MNRVYSLGILLLGLLAQVVTAAEGTAPATFKAGAFTFARPSKWDWETPASSMRAAQMKIKGHESQVAEALFFYFGPGNGGGPQANIDRWIGQFQEPREKLNPKIKEETIGSYKVSFFDAQGTYLSGMPGAPTKTAMPGSMLKGAIIEHPEGCVFIRITGPIDLVKTQDDALRKMIQGALKK